jgi:hypothetical protein
LATNRVKNLSNISTPNAEDLLLIITDPNNLPGNKNITIEQLFKNLRANNSFLASFPQAIIDRNLQINGDIDLKNTATTSDIIKIIDSGTSDFRTFVNGAYAHSDNRSYEITIASATQFTVKVDGGTAGSPVTVNSDNSLEIDSANVYVKFTANTGHTTGDKFVIDINRESAINFGASSIIQEDTDVNNSEISNNGTILMESGVEMRQEVDPVTLRANTSAISVEGNIHFENRITHETETVSGDGSGTDAVSVTVPVTFLNTSGGTSSLTMAAGITGQIKHVIMTVAGSAATMTNTNGNLDTTAVSTSIVFDAVGECATLIYTGSKWIPISVIGATIS